MGSFISTDVLPAWLDEIEGGRALDWARARSAETDDLLDDGPLRGELEESILAALDTDARIPYPVRRGDYLYNFWRDADHPRGLWRRTSLERSEEHTSELQSRFELVCRLLLEKQK